ncbi:unnamed protein product [Meloidogyne enterolobii]|uniref:Uncharacterized protein n=1 Tax=Meloidogyne enterolobii TaxID=390850 RepID=A0ACB1A0Y2_MELEN
MNNNPAPLKEVNKTENLNKQPQKIREKLVNSVLEFINTHEIKNSSSDEIEAFLHRHFFLKDWEVDEVISRIVEQNRPHKIFCSTPVTVKGEKDLEMYFFEDEILKLKQQLNEDRENFNDRISMLEAKYFALRGRTYVLEEEYFKFCRELDKIKSIIANNLQIDKSVLIFFKNCYTIIFTSLIFLGFKNLLFNQGETRPFQLLSLDKYIFNFDR